MGGDQLGTLRSVSSRALGDVVKRLAPRWFVVRDAHAEGGPVLLQPRWAMSFLTGPMTRHELSQALKARTAPAEATDVAPDHDHAIAAE